MKTPRPASQVIVDPQELTQFLRQSQDFSDLVTSTLQPSKNGPPEVSNRIRAKEINNRMKPKPQTRPSPAAANQQRREPGVATGWKKYVGIPLAMTGGLFMTLTYILVKKLSTKYHPVSLCWWQFGIHAILSIPIILYFCVWKKVNVFKSGWANEVVRITVRRKAGIIGAILVTSISGVTAILLKFVVLQYLQVGDATIIAFSGSLFTIGFGHFFLYEKCGFVTIPVSCFILFGTFLLTRPPFLSGESEYDTQLLIGVSLALVTTILVSGCLTAMRKLRQVHFSVILLGGGLLGLAECGLATVIIGVRLLPELDSMDMTWIVAIGLLSFFGMMAIFGALKFEQAGAVNLTRMLDVVFSFVFQYYFLGDIPDGFSMIGATIVLTGVSIIGLRSILLTLPPDNYCRRTCCCLLN